MVEVKKVYSEAQNKVTSLAVQLIEKEVSGEHRRDHDCEREEWQMQGG